MPVEGRLPAQQRGPDNFVDGVVPANVFIEIEEISGCVKQPGGVQTASVVECGLAGSKAGGKPRDQVPSNARLGAVEERATDRFQSLDRRFSAHPAARGE